MTRSGPHVMRVKSRTYEVNLSRELCLSCLKCCKGEGWVYINMEERKAIAKYLGITPGELVDTYCEQKDGWTYLKAKQNKDLDCIFLNRKHGCEIYPVRPKQCADFPYKWRYENITDECPGVREV
ncbi:MAG: YkgJ family cysteine cluster protein [Candidatus Omnitrophica bacterium]|nr:YkgJ family cysteine cluster protein [Candidatus Omnitrophota bacterium]